MPLQMTQQEIIDLCDAGGFIGQSIAGDWWRYLPDHRPGLAKMIEADVPEQMRRDGIIKFGWRDVLAKTDIYILATPEDQRMKQRGAPMLPGFEEAE